MLATTTKRHPFNWEYQIHKVCMAYNTSIHVSKGYSAFFLMFGQQAKLPIDLMYGTGESSEFPTKDYAVHLKKSLEEDSHLVHEQLSTSHERRKEHYDRHVHCEPYKEGDLVWLYSPVVQQGYTKKLHHPWTGPCFIIVNKLLDSDYKIRGTWGRKTTGIFIYGIPMYMHI